MADIREPYAARTPRALSGHRVSGSGAGRLQGLSRWQVQTRYGTVRRQDTSGVFRSCILSFLKMLASIFYCSSSSRRSSSSSSSSTLPVNFTVKKKHNKRCATSEQQKAGYVKKKSYCHALEVCGEEGTSRTITKPKKKGQRLHVKCFAV